MVAAGVVFAWGMASGARAEVLLTINIYDPSAVVISATSGVASATADGIGLWLPNLFFQRVDDDNFKDPAATLQTVQGQSLEWNLGWLQVGSVDGAIWPLRVDVVNFVQNETAFAGRATLDLSSVVPSMQAVGFTGEIYAYQSESQTIVGEYQVISEVPEPGGLALGGVAVVGAWLLARRREGIPWRA